MNIDLDRLVKIRAVVFFGQVDQNKKIMVTYGKRKFKISNSITKPKTQKQNGVLTMNINTNTMTVEESIKENTNDVNNIQNSILLTIWKSLGQAQKQILIAWADGQKNKQIATACRMSIDNVISIKKSIRDKAQEIFPEAVIDFDFGIYA